MKTNFKNIIAVALIGITLASGCKDNALEEITSPNFSRAFSVSGLKVVVSGKVNAVFTWEKVKNAKTYTIEIYKTADFSGTPARTIADLANTLTTYTVSGLDGDTQYYARIKSTGSDGADDSKWMTAVFKTEPEQIFEDIASGKITPNSVTLNWPANASVTTIKIAPGDITKNLTPAEIAAGEATVTGLSPLTTYTATILLNGVARGTKNFTTLSNLPTGADVVYVAATDDLAAMIQAATQSTRFVVLQGTKYDAATTVTLPVGLDISIIGESGPVQPIISFNLIALPAVGGKLHFENVEVTGYANGDATTTKRQYLINQNTAYTVTMEEVSFENCTIQHFANTVIRLQNSVSTNSVTINKLIVNNCIVNDIVGGGSYYFINTNVANGKINNITLTNSSFSGIGVGLIQHTLAPSVSVAIENNTFYNVVAGSKYLIDYNAQIVSTSYTFKNNIIGKTYGTAAKGIRGATVPTLDNNYQASDTNITGNAISGITTYTGASTDLFTAPESLNFKIKDDTFLGKSTAGDPRWRL